MMENNNDTYVADDDEILGLSRNARLPHSSLIPELNPFIPPKVTLYKTNKESYQT